MKTLDIKATIFREIDELYSQQLKEVYGLFQNYLNNSDDTDEWDKLSGRQQETIMVGIKQANANDTKPIDVVTERLRKKYYLNG